MIFDFSKKGMCNDWIVSFLTYLVHHIYLSNKNTVSVGKEVTFELSTT